VREGESRQPAADAFATIPRVGAGSGEGRGQRRYVADGKDLADPVNQIRRAADGVADHGHQTAGHALVDN
jgi:hypothetical protein